MFVRMIFPFSPFWICVNLNRLGCRCSMAFVTSAIVSIRRNSFADLCGLVFVVAWFVVCFLMLKSPSISWIVVLLFFSVIRVFALFSSSIWLSSFWIGLLVSLLLLVGFATL